MEYLITSYRIVCGDKRSCQTITTNGIVTVPNTNQLVVPVTEQNFAHTSRKDPYYILISVAVDNTKYHVSYDLGVAGTTAVTGTAPVDSNEYARNANVTVKAYTEGSNIVVPAGYVFDYWLLEGTSTAYSAGASFPITQDSNLIAQWKVASYSLTTSHDANTTILPSCSYNYEETDLNVTFGVSSGYSISNITVDGTDLDATALASAVSNGYVTISKTASHTVSISSSAIGYGITYFWTGAPASETLPTDSNVYHVGDDVTVNSTYANGTKVDIGHDHYTFSGWDISGLVNGKMPASNLTISGSWEKTTDSTYKVIYDANGGSGAPASVTGLYSGSTLTLTGDSSTVTKPQDLQYTYT
ncbi:MAG: hypothetical protein EOM14_11925, partial [Clostridia bacterium]|nr:hypothetical protein [Clostridia bacterium]